jgi:transcriptional antiterminator
MLRGMNIKVVIRIHELISLENTGNPKSFADLLDVSERTVYNYISFMREELKVPIDYCPVKGSYYYLEPPGLQFVAKRKKT